MAIDIVMPEGNEKDFINIAKRLGYDSIVFCYSQRSFPKKLIEDSKLSIHTALMIPGKQAIRFNNRLADILIALGSDDDRQVFESGRADAVLGLEKKQKQDFLHHRNSGLNQILAKIAAEKKTALAISFNDILSEKKQRPRMLGRILQNIKLCRKYKANMLFASFANNPYQMRAPHDLEAVAKTFGMTGREAKDSLSFAKKIINRNLKRRSKTHLAEGIELVE